MNFPHEITLGEIAVDHHPVGSDALASLEDHSDGASASGFDAFDGR